MVAYHRQYPLLKGDFFLPVHVGRAVSAITKDGIINNREKEWLLRNLTGDDTGDNISVRNREFSECTGLYWFWKNYPYQECDYVGFFSYRRQLILNDLFDRAPNRSKKVTHKCVELNKKRDVCRIAGINEDRIIDILNKYDYIVPLRSSLEKINIHSVYEDYLKVVPGVHVHDIFSLEDVFASVYPEETDTLREYLRSPNKMMYHIFIMKSQLFNDYCEWLFNLLFLVEPHIDSTYYSINGKRTIGYLAEILFGYYFTNKVPQEKTFNTGVTYLI